MSCPHLDEHLRPELTLPQRGQLAQHAEACAECHARLALGQSLLRVLAFDVPPLSAPAKARAWAELDAARTSSPWTFGWVKAGGLAFAVAAAVLLVLRFGVDSDPPPGILVAGSARLLADDTHAAVNDPIAPEVWLQLEAGSVVRVGEGEVRARSTMALWLPERPDLEPLRIAYGQADLVVASAAPKWLLQTPAGRIELTSGRFELRVEDDRTRVEVIDGRARLEDESGGVKSVSAGSQGHLGVPEPEAIAPTPAADPEPPANGEPPDAELGRAEKAKRPRASRTRRDQKELAEARAWVGKDDARAQQIAETVLSRSPAGPTEVEALMLVADTWRRRGHRAEAEQFYRRAVQHPGSAGFAEEAMLRRAALLSEMARSDEAIEVLQDAQSKFGARGLAPERSALFARLLMVRGDLDGAATVLEGVASSVDRILDEPRLEVARALLPRSPARAVRLVRALVDQPGPAGVQAKALVERAQSEKAAD